MDSWWDFYNPLQLKENLIVIWMWYLVWRKMPPVVNKPYFKNNIFCQFQKGNLNLLTLKKLTRSKIQILAVLPINKFIYQFETRKKIIYLLLWVWNHQVALSPNIEDEIQQFKRMAPFHQPLLTWTSKVIQRKVPHPV